MRVENNLIAIVITIHEFLEGIKDVRIESFLADWPSENCITRSVLPHSLPVLSQMPAAVKAAGKNTEFIVNMLACGFLFLGLQIEYPRHRHEAEEVYVPLTELTLWQRSNHDWAYRAAGLPIYHAPWMPHAMRTETVPLVALYLWRGGNLVQKSIIE